MTAGRAPAGNGTRPPERVWYTAYGSNMSSARLACYLAGGRPPGGARAYRGCRDSSPPAASRPVELRGVVYFATESAVWTGGRAFYDPDAEGRVLARAHLLTVEQFADIVAQEMYRDPAAPASLAGVHDALARGRARLGEGRYETLVRPGTLDGIPLLTFTAPWGVADLPPNPPSPAYLRQVASGLAEAGWGPAEAADHLMACPGVAGAWTRQDVLRLVTAPESGSAPA